MITYLHKDITTVEAPAIIMHGVNCRRAMNSGVAKALSDKWPIVKKIYMAIPKHEMLLGATQMVKVSDSELFVVNCWTQEKYGYDSKRYADTDAISYCIRVVVTYAIVHNITNIYSPRIGCGLGGLSWQDDVEPLFLIVSEMFPYINITICDIN